MGQGEGGGPHGYRRDLLLLIGGDYRRQIRRTQCDEGMEVLLSWLPLSAGQGPPLPLQKTQQVERHQSQLSI